MRTLYADEKIESVADSVRERYGLNFFPVVPEVIADAERINVFSARFRNPDIAGLITKRDGEVFIYIRDGDPAVRKRFTFAHELGHYYLHLQKGKGTNFIDAEHMFRMAGSQLDEVEAEANIFAAALLMPEREVRELCDAHVPLREMAEYFMVSNAAMYNRVRNLGLRV
ncbi:hypothetical protein GCM10025857_06510 [Alicyclobacillus contaminans]|uniref:ImmA/IrrE family metallo-endopeptidase n=1 Tax=Alicyclobacillus contaminans TaxID=392016 RepID=UPI0003FC9EF5|nr:ImmA/IrrE family metallo-endopeptidase [Alicyclobacillus contaminans]GMA49294.1 hypothetical protein GCM10025857_06510 [Alicyclobacillus contaminans]